MQPKLNWLKPHDKIVIEFIKPEEQRYTSCGDYWIDKDGNWQIRVSRMSDWRSEVNVALHELWEMALVIHHGISMEAIDHFDINFEQTRKVGDESEQGDHVDSPYREEHTSATAAERMMADALGMKWREHEKNVNAST